MSQKKDSILQDLSKRIPGYGSYLQQESRRDDDRLTRAFVAKRLGECKSNLDAVASAAVASGDLDTPARIEKLRNRVELAQNRITSAVEGYSGWFSKRTVDAKLLEEIGKLDENLVSLVDQLDATAQTYASQNAWDAAEFLEIADRLHARIDRRTELLKTGS